MLFLVAATPAPSGSQEAGGAVRDDGASLFLQNCASCHGPQGQGSSAGPSLVGVGAAAADFFLSTGRMPLGAPGQPAIRQQPRFTDAQIQALVEHVASFAQHFSEQSFALPTVRRERGAQLVDGDVLIPEEIGPARAVGLGDTSGSNVEVTHGRLRFLGDVFALPHQLPLANVFSVPHSTCAA